MGESLITRRAGAGGGEATITFENYSHATNLAHTGASALSSARSYLAGASVGEYALFAGGTSNISIDYSTLDAYNTSLTHSTPTTLSTARRALAGASVGNYVLFAGGSTTSSDTRSAVVDAYNTSLTRSTPTALRTARSFPVGASVGGYALLAGGASYSSTVDAFVRLDGFIMPKFRFVRTIIKSESSLQLFDLPVAIVQTGSALGALFPFSSM